MNSRKTGFLRLLLLAVLLNVVAQMIHEGGHWAVYQAYGRGPVWGFIGLVQMWGETPLHPAEWVKTADSDGEQGWLHLSSAVNSKAEDLISSAAGPLASLLGAVLALLLARRSRERSIRQIGLMLCLVTSFTMSLYYLRGPMRTGGDEFSVALSLGIPKAFVDIPLGLAFAACLVLALRELEDWKTRLVWLAVLLLGGIPVGLALNSADAIVRMQVNRGDPLFMPVLGFSLPVLMVDGLALGGLWLWRRARPVSQR